jgi:hypothetical protein
MSQIQERPFATRTEGELFLMSEFLEREIKSMSEKNALVQAEMRFRAEAIAGGPVTLDYRSDTTLNGKIGGIGDSYADQSKAYAIRMSLIGIGVLVVIAAVVCLVV